MSVIKVDIAHGTLKGFRQHQRRSDVPCDSCITAKREDEKAKDAERLAAQPSHAQQGWNGGMTGVTRPASSTAVIERCTVDGCGLSNRPATTARYCAGRCAAIGRALADLRSGGWSR